MSFVKQIMRALSNMRAESQGTLSRALMNDNEFVRLVSFPRTGSHWLRMLLEMYTDRPLLTRSFLKHDNHNYLLLHTHDNFLAERPLHVIYLYRDPVETIFSQVKYYEQDPNDQNIILFWLYQYLSHLVHWLSVERFTKTKLVLRYDVLELHFSSEFERVCNYLEIPFIEDRALMVASQCTKSLISKATRHDKRVINRSEDYYETRDAFREKFSHLIWETAGDFSSRVFGDKGVIPLFFNGATSN